MEKLLGPTLVDNQGGKFSSSAALGAAEVVGIYFADSAHTPCSHFLPHLVSFYSHMQKGEKRKLEVVFVSFEEASEEKFDKHFAQMPWFAVPYADRQRKGKLCKRFKVVTIPSLLLVTSQGELITADGKHRVLEDPEGAAFPWRPAPFADVMGQGALLDCCTKKELSPAPRLKGKKLGLFFAAHWCPPCRSLTGELIQTYQRLRADNRNFEIIYLSSDTNEQNFTKFTSNMPWLTLPYKDKRIAQLAHLFSITGIPQLVIVDEYRQVITRHGREAVQEDPEGEEFPWYPRTVEELSDTSYHYLNECTCLILFTSNTDEDIDRSMDMLHPIALRHIELVSSDPSHREHELVFLVAGNDEPVSGLVRRYAHLPPTCPMLVLLDVPEKKKFVDTCLPGPADPQALADRVSHTVSLFTQEKLPFTEIPTNFDYSYL